VTERRALAIYAYQANGRGMQNSLFLAALDAGKYARPKTFNPFSSMSLTPLITFKPKSNKASACTIQELRYALTHSKGN
jgi:hypothetical protein